MVEPTARKQDVKTGHEVPVLNRDWVLFNLDEAIEELRGLRQEIAEEPDEEEANAELRYGLAHALGHLFGMWNLRHDPNPFRKFDDDQWRQAMRCPRDLKRF